jgi:alkylation response protein AidB-like acyl-CoA dehydrogenase
MTIAISADHRQLESVVESVLTAFSARLESRSLLDGFDEHIPAFWRECQQGGWLGVHIVEELGGSGYGLPELVVIVEELGHAVAAGSFIPTVITSAVIAATADERAQRQHVPGLVSGEVFAGVGLSGSLRWNGDMISGDAGVVIGAGMASRFLLCVGEDVVLIDAAAAGVQVVVPSNVDPTRRSGRVQLSEVRPVLRIARACATAEAFARIILSAEAVGGATACVEMSSDYARERQQFGRPIGTFQAVKHHCANMFVAAEVSAAAVWNAARADPGDPAQFQLGGAMAAALAIPAYLDNAQLNIQVHGGVGFTWEHDAHLLLRRAIALRAIVDGRAAAVEVSRLVEAGTNVDLRADLPDGVDKIREEIRDHVSDLVGLSAADQRKALIDTGYIMPHWPRPWGRAASAAEQLITDEEFASAGIQRPDYGITSWLILTVLHHGTDDQIGRWVRRTLDGEFVWCQLFSEPDAGSDAAGIRTRASRVDGGWLVNGQKVWTSGAERSQRGLATVRTDPTAPKHHGITAMAIDMASPGIEVRPLRMITGGTDFNEVFFTDVFVPDDDVLGSCNEGWTVARTVLANERITLGARAPTQDSEDLTALLALHGGRFEGAAWLVGRLLAKELTLGILNLRRAQRAIAGGEAGPEGNITKLLLAECFQERADLTGDLRGPDIAFTDGPGSIAAMMLLGSHRLAIAGGTSEITRNQIGERILKLPRDPLLR